MTINELRQKAYDLRLSAESDYKWAMNGALSLEYNAWIASGDEKHDRAAQLERQAKEQEYVEAQARLHDEVTVKNLKRIQEYGFVRSRIVTETLTIAGLIIFSGPRAGLPYNHYKLTESGLAFLSEKDQA